MQKKKKSDEPNKFQGHFFQARQNIINIVYEISITIFKKRIVCVSVFDHTFMDT